jgi:hypothetical protein
MLTLSSEGIKGRDHSGELDIGGRVILNQILLK